MKSIMFSTAREFKNKSDYGLSTLLSFHHNRKMQHVFISAGSDDDIFVYREFDRTYVVSINYGLPYVGLEIFGNNAEKGFGLIGEIFLQEDYKIIECLGKNGENKAPYWIASVLKQYCEV